MSVSPVQQATAVAAVFTTKIEPGQTWYLLAHKWWDGWKKYTQFAPDRKDKADFANLPPPTVPEPGPIDNSALLEGDAQLKKDISEGSDFDIVNEEVRKLLKSWYPGASEIARKVIEVGRKKESRLDLYPFMIRVVWLDSKGDRKSVV